MRPRVGMPRCPAGRGDHDWQVVADAVRVCRHCGAARDRYLGYLSPQATAGRRLPRLVALVPVAALLWENPREALAFLWCIVAHPAWLHRQGTQARIAWCPACCRMVVLE